MGENSKKAAGQARVCIPLFYLIFFFLLWARLEPRPRLKKYSVLYLHFGTLQEYGYEI